MSNFSTMMMLADLDYIAPSQACVKPMLLNTGNNNDSLVQVHHPGQQPAKDEIIKISLQDCLACSGCVTTAETLLVAQQSRGEIETVVSSMTPSSPGQQPGEFNTLCVSISDQSAASIAIQLGISIVDAFHCISGFCRDQWKAHFVIDMRWAHHVSLLETYSEFDRRVHDETKTKLSELPLIVSSCPGWICYCEKTHPKLIPYLSPVMSAQAITGAYVKQFLTRWVENKQIGNTGNHNVQNNKNAPRVKIYHVSIQPCFDKKLEAARPDYQSPTTGERDTDCVLSSQELLEWMRAVVPEGQQCTTAWRAPLDSHLDPIRAPSEICEAAAMEGSGGYHQHMMQQHAHRRGGVPTPPLTSLQYQTKRNANYKVVTYSDEVIQRGGTNASSLQGMEFCVAYGFGHIQNIVRGFTRHLSNVTKYKFIELMACPEGCLNGGGQIRTKHHEQTLAAVNGAFEAFTAELAEGGKVHEPKEKMLRREVQQNETSATTLEEDPTQRPFSSHMTEEEEHDGPYSLHSMTARSQHPPLFSVESVYEDWLQVGGPMSDAAHLKLSTQFHDRKKQQEEESAGMMHSLKW